MQRLFFKTIFILISLFSIKAAAEQVYTTAFHPDNTPSEFIVVYKEYNHHIIDRYEQPQNDYQTKIETIKFSSQSAVDFYILRHAKQVGLPQNFINKSQSNFNLQIGESIWQATNEWNNDWENQYSAWVAEKMDAEFFMRYSIATDCADVAIATRWIFARIHKLPMANQLAGTNRLFTNETILSRYRDLPTDEVWFNDQKFRAALDYLLEHTYTKSLILDSYPIQITPESLTEGSHYLYLEPDYDSGHTLLVNEVDKATGFVYTVNSTVPRLLRKLYSSIYYNSRQPLSKEWGGFLKIRWAKKVLGTWQLTPERNMPGYSTEQYAEDFVTGQNSFDDEVFKRLGKDLDFTQLYIERLDALIHKLEERVTIVEEGYAFCQTNDCSPGTQNYDDWSTPSRDKKISQMWIRLEYDRDYSPEARESWQNFLNSKVNIDGQDYTYRDATAEFRYSTLEEYLSDPREPVIKRWGLHE